LRTDPTDTGGLFVGRRPGTGPVRYRALPPEGSVARKRVDTLISWVLVGLITLIALSYWGPLPLLSLWVGSQVQYLTGSPGAGILSAFLLVLGVLLLGLTVMKALDRAWVLVRRSAGHDQREGVLGLIFGITCAVGATAFAIWLIVFSGAELAPVGIHF
jgi:hypothetical protein